MPAHPMPAAAARTAAAGVLFAVFAFVAGGVAVLAIVAARLIVAGDDHLAIEGASLVLLVVGFGLANAATLTLLTRIARPSTLTVAAAAAIVWPLSGHALLAAPVALVLVALLAMRDQRVRGSRRAGPTLGVALAAAATVMSIAGAVTATTERTAASPRGGDDTRAGREEAPAGSDEAPAPRGGDDTPTGREETPAGSDEAPAPRGDDTPTAQDGDDAPRGDATPAGRDEAPAPRGGDDVPTAPAGALPTPRADDAASTPRDASPGAATGPEAFVRAYYADLNAQRFAEAWAKLSPAVQATLGPYARWKAGYGTTISSTPRGFVVGDDRVTHMLVARDKGCDRARQFRVTWQLRSEGREWRVNGLAAVAIGSQEC
ncbi:hypothetical protein DVA67_032295 [Solirubrobacter sp. CPCC 204708]|uniref:Uncharacterized protein n=1 Tax=Solirubrobacter deserti TaxID=2282478 RepID=A0ABT4RQW6_9ACTN|nr:hypothetical protein [Solirubrobacter deserti]MBE2320686.1 hypothetical protein [Solirubrobacter deserti]MDA0140911.1 hypothetical protein [Solirubrobacter deserti]